MKKFLSRLPLPVSVLALGWVILGNIFQNEIIFLGDLCMIISSMLIVLTMLKAVFNIKAFMKSINSPIGLSLMSSFSMSIIMISVWMKGVFGKSNIYIWAAGVIIQTVIIVVFTIKYVINFKMKHMFPSWFLVYSGIGTAAITANDFGMIVFGKAVFRFVVIASVILVPFIIVKIFKKGNTVAARPLLSLVTVPLGVIIPAYIAIAEHISQHSLNIMLIALQILFFIVLISMVIQIFDGFYASWACYALSSSITLYGTTVMNNYLNRINKPSVYLESLIYIEYVVVFVICIITLLAYFINTLEDPAKRELELKKAKERRREHNRKKTLTAAMGGFAEKDRKKKAPVKKKAAEKNAKSLKKLQQEKKISEKADKNEKIRDGKHGSFEDYDNIDDLLD